VGGDRLSEGECDGELERERQRETEGGKDRTRERGREVEGARRYRHTLTSVATAAGACKSTPGLRNIVHMPRDSERKREKLSQLSIPPTPPPSRSRKPTFPKCRGGGTRKRPRPPPFAPRPSPRHGTGSSHRGTAPSRGSEPMSESPRHPQEAACPSRCPSHGHQGTASTRSSEPMSESVSESPWYLHNGLGVKGPHYAWHEGLP
jgi:hypothetical protein